MGCGSSKEQKNDTTEPYVRHKQGEKVNITKLTHGDAEKEVQLTIVKQLGQKGIREFYKFTQSLGEGTFGHVGLGIHRKTGAERAIKVISWESYPKKHRHMIHREI